MKKEIIWFLIGAIITVLLMQKCRPDNTADAQLKRMYDAARDTLLVYKGKNGENIAEIASLTATRASLLSELDIKDQTIQRLQQVVADTKNPETVIVHETVTEYRDTGSVVIVHDTITNEIVYPITAATVDSFVVATVDLHRDHSDWFIQVNDNFDYILESRKRGLFGSKGTTYNIKAVSHNPYTYTENLRSFTLDHKNDRFHVGLYTGYDPTSGVSIGVGLMYSIFSF